MHLLDLLDRSILDFSVCATVYEWYERATLPIEKGGMAIRNMGVVALTAFACSLAASLKHMASIFPE